MTDIQDPISGAARSLNEIPFVEFTSQLVTGVFAALLDANAKQTATYMELVKNMGATMEEFMKKTKDDISMQEIAGFLDKLPLDVQVGKPLSDGQAQIINEATKLPAEAGTEAGTSPPFVAAASLDEASVNAIHNAVARRIAINRYDMLREMVRQGMLRLVVNNGLIETRLQIHTHAWEWHEELKRQETGGGGSVRGATGGIGGGLLAGIIGKGIGGIGGIGGGGVMGGASVFTVRSVDSTDQQSGESTVDIFGRVQLQFRTDFLPLQL